MRVAWLSIAILVAATSISQAQPTFEAVLAPPETPYHRAITYTISVTGDASLQCEFPDIPTDEKQVEVRRLAQENAPAGETGLCITQRYQLDPIFPGQYKVPALTVNWKSGDDAGTLTLPPLAFNARELTSSEAEAAAVFTGIASPDTVLPPPSVSSKGLFLLAGIGIVAFVAFLLAFRYFRRKRQAPAIVLPSWDVALNRLRELERRNLPGTGKIDAYYVDLSAILRYYIEDRFHIRAPEQTTPEFLDKATQSETFSEDQQQFLSDFLRQCDRVKFARLQPGLEDMTTHFKQVRHFIKDTMPPESAETTLEQAA